MRCLSEAELLELVEGRMSSVSSSIEAHLDGCDACRELVVIAASLDPAPRVDDERYEILGEVGRGGQSRVMRAYDRQLDREIALKQFVGASGSEAGEGPSPADRCLREVRVTGALSHPAIVPIHDMGMRRSGAPFYTMPLIDGPTLAEVVERTPTTQARLRLLPHVVQVCQAVAYAHGRGFIHRDIKPANVMVGSFGQTILLDWGLARVPGQADQSSGGRGVPGDAATVDGAIMGTPAFMSPEQASGDPQAIGQWSDVWGLGAVLYYVLCGYAPFRGNGVEDTLRRVRRGVARPIAPTDGTVPAELAAIVRKAMAAAPEDRYPSATALADDLIAFGVGARVSAYSYRRRERVARFAARYRNLLVVVAVVFVALCSITVVLARSYATEAAAHANAAAAAEEAERARAQAESLAEDNRLRALAGELQLARAHVDTAEREREAARPLTARLYAAASLDHNPAFAGNPGFDADSANDVDARELVARALGQLALDRLELIAGVTDPPPGWDRSAKLADADVEGTRVAISDGTAVASIRSIDQRTEIARLPGHDGPVRYIVLSPAASHAMTQDTADIIRRWRLPEGVEDGRWPLGARGLARAAVSDQGALAFKDDTGGVTFVAARETVPQRRLDIVDPSQMRFSDDGQWLAVVTRAGRLHLVSGTDGRELGQVELSPAMGSTEVAFTHDGTTIVAGVSNSVIFVDRATLRVLGTVSCRGHVAAIAVSADDRHVYAAGSRAVSVIDRFDRRRLAELASEVIDPYWVWSSGDQLGVAGLDRAAGWTLRPATALPGIGRVGRVTDRGGPVTRFVVPEAGAQVHGLDWNSREHVVESLPDARPIEIVVSLGLRIAALHDDRRLTIWSHRDGHWQLDHEQRLDAVPVCMTASPDGTRLALQAHDGRLWVVGTDGSSEPELILHGRAVSCRALAFSTSGDRLFAGGRTSLLWDLRAAPDGAPISVTIEDASTDRMRAAIFADDDTIYAAGEFGVQEIFGDGSLGRRLTEEPRRTVEAGDGWLVATGEGGALDLWRLPDAERVLATRASGASSFFDATVEPGGMALRLIGSFDSYRLPLTEQHADGSAALLAAARRAAGHDLDRTNEGDVR